MSDYQQLSAQFRAVRHSWKRTTALSGLAIVVSEGVGILTVLLLLDWLFKPLPFVRVALWALALAGIAYFFVRHVLAPLMRKIPDEQIALYIEEHRNELDGVLITAAEYAGKGEQQPGQEALIAAVMREASERSVHTAIKRVVDLSRLKKYSIGAVAGIVLYVLASMLFPNAVAHHVGRVLQPWQVTVEDRAKKSGSILLEPIEFTLNHTDTNLARGASFDLEATLSRTADKPVLLNFHSPNASGEWQKLPLTEIEKLNGFKGTLADVSEELEFYVSCGGDKSKTYHITVFDPLVVQSLEVTTHYPDYTKLPDRVEKQSSGDIEALIGSKVTVRILANVPLKDGQIKWTDGQTQNLSIDPAVKTAASATFEVKENASYDYSIGDVNGQKASSATSLSVRAVPDNPPTIEVKSPESYVFTHPLGEIDFEADATDDFGVASVDLVYLRLGSDGKSTEVRVPLKLEAADSQDSSNITAMHASTRFMLEDAKPAFSPEDVISYHLEARDTKGQKAVSEIGLITVGYFETWATWLYVIPEEHGPHADEGPDLLAMLKAVWLLDSQKTNLAPTDYQQQSKDMADLMTDKQTGGVRSFVNLRRYPQLARVADKIALHAGKAHEALVGSKTDVASTELQIAAALYTGGKLQEDLEMEKHAPINVPNTAAMTAEPAAATLLEAARLDAVKESAADKARTEKEKAESQQAAATSSVIADLIKKQDELISKAKNQLESQTKSDDSSGSKPQASSLAPVQQDISDKTKAAAKAARFNPAATAGSKLQLSAEKTDNASLTMHDAAHDFEGGKNPEALAKATQARKELQEALDTLIETDRDKLEAAISRLEARTEALLGDQRDVRGSTETVAKELPENQTADQRQKRDLQALSFKEAKLQGEAGSIITEIDQLSKWAEQVGKPETTRALGEALRTIKRGQPDGKMASAVIELNSASPSPAVDDQKLAEAALEKILADLRAGSEALADSRAALVKIAARDAREAVAAANELSKSDQPASGAGDAKQPAAGDAKQPAAGDAKQAAAAAGDAKHPAAGNASQPATEAQRKADAQKLANEMARLAGKLNDRQIVSQEDINKLKQQLTMDKTELAKKLLVDPKLLSETKGVIERINNKLEAEIASTAEAKTLFSSQREECPPAYRQFVNKYFEALSQVARPPGLEGGH